MLYAIKFMAEELIKIGVESYCVGGTVRDRYLEGRPDDYDVCLVGVKDIPAVEKIIKKHIDSVQQVGMSFPVWKTMRDGHEIDIALARTERLIGDTRQDFKVSTIDVTIEDDLKRRDLTINAMAINVLTGDIIDPYGGMDDIRERIARPVSNAFSEDTLRVIRAARFISRFELTPHISLLETCARLKPTDLSNERVGMELMKVLQHPTDPSPFFHFLKEVGWLRHHFQELEALIDVPQDPQHHPEGDAFIHTMHAIDAAKGGWKIRAAMLCHDLGKAYCTTMRLGDRKIQSIGHEYASVELTKTMLKRVHLCNHADIDQIACLVENHMIRCDTITEKVVRKTLRKLMAYNVSYSQLHQVCQADMNGRPPLPKANIFMNTSLADALIRDGEMKPIVTATMLREIGIEDGKDMGEILKICLDLQDRCTLTKDNWKSVLRGCSIPVLKDKL